MYFGYFILAFLISFLLTVLVRWFMKRWEIVDWPRTEERKIHKKKIPLGGGLAIFGSFFILAFLLFWHGNWLGINIDHNHVLALFIGGLVLLIGGFVDDKYNLRPRYQLLSPIIASLIIVAFGIGPSIITNPFGGVWQLNNWQLNDYLTSANLLVFLWLMGMMYTTKLLDGLDGLVSGIVAIGALLIGILCLQTAWLQPDVALLAIIFSGACTGFLVWNWHPAKIFLGEGGSLFTGFILGSLAIIAGGKIAITVLIMGVPMFDIVRVMILRIRKDKSIFSGDREHLHFRLLASGLSQKQTVLLFYAIALLFGVTALFLQSSQKLIALIFLFVLMILTGLWFTKKS